jgi:predicted ArsR family transcriptional regulator
MDLFAYTAAYPDAPGYRDRDTSRAAAESMDNSAPVLRQRCIDVLRHNGPLTADEVASRLDCSVLSIRPRFTELLHNGQIEDTGKRHANASGRAAKVWRLV